MAREHHVTRAADFSKLPSDVGRGDVVHIYLRGRGFKSGLAVLFIVVLGSLRVRVLRAQWFGAFRFWAFFYLLGFRLLFWAWRRNLLRV